MGFAMVLVLFFLFPRFFFSSSTLTGGHKNIISVLSNEFGIAIGKVYSPGLAFLLVRIFYFILYSNFLGLIPYIFTPTRHLAVTVSLTLPLWVGYITFIILKNLNSFCPASSKYNCGPHINSARKKAPDLSKVNYFSVNLNLFRSSSYPRSGSVYNSILRV